MRYRFAAPFTLALVFGLAAGCGGAGFSVEGHTLNTKDTAFYAASSFCEAMTSNQIQISIVDYTPVCNGDPDPTKDRSQIDMIISLGAQADTKKPYMVQKVDCTNGPAAPGLFRFRHFPAGTDAADFDKQADSGSVTFTSFSTAGPLKGNFDVLFGTEKVSGSFESFACN